MTVDVEVLRGRLQVLTARARAAADTSRTMDVDAVAGSVEQLLDDAWAAANGGHDRRWRRICDWWSGRRLELAFHYLHAAEVELCELYDDVEVDALTPETLARVEAVLPPNDPRLHAAQQLRADTDDRRSAATDAGGHLQLAVRRSQLRKAVETGHAAADRQHRRVRNFRNVVFVAGFVMILLASVFVLLLGRFPTWVPLCFDGPTGRVDAVCPTGANGGPAAFDALVVVLLGVMGGAVAAAMAIRNLRGTSTPYDIPVALAWLKLPLGGLTALVGLIAIRGEFVPGLSELGSQEQILAYALMLGYAQQALTMRIDRQAREVLDGVPGGEPSAAPVAAGERAVPAGRPAPAM